MPLGERIKELRKEAGWSQGELADKVSTDARQISRYENARITPSLDALVRIAEALNVSVDHLVFDDVPRRPLRGPENILGDRLAAIAELSDDDRHSLLNVIDGLVTKSRIKAIAATSS
jgi:transcriptional regulator with XRE-family HTH domain